MSIDTHILLRTPLNSETLAESLAREYGMKRQGDWLVGDHVSAIIGTWTEDDRYVIEGGFPTASVLITLIPESNDSGFAAQWQLIANILRAVPGDACAQGQNDSTLGLLRLGDVVYIDPIQIRPEDLIENGYTPKELVIGVPIGLADRQ